MRELWDVSERLEQEHWMKASAVEYRFRYLIHAVVYTLGFLAPWDRVYPVDTPGTSTWLGLAAWPAREGWLSFSASTVALLVFGIVCAVSGAWLRTWGAAYIGSGVVQDGGMHGEAMVAEGPFRYLRNPLYVGTWLHTLALGLLMPVSGAVFCVVVIAVFQARLALAEEPFLTAKLGAAYTAYCAKVPRFLPAMRARVVASGQRPRWGQAALGEVYFWGVAGSFAVAGWRYNAFLLMKCVVVSLGVSMVARAVVGKGK